MLHMLGVLGVHRAVLVQPSVYGTDNALITEALSHPGFELRGVAVVAPDITADALHAMHLQGFRGIRINTASATPGLQLQHVPALADRIRPLGWHLQFFVDFQRQPELAGQLAELDIPIVIDHFGKVPANGRVASPAARAFLRLLAQAMVALAPDHLLWGTDWPHPSARHQMPNDGDLADMLSRWAPDETTRRQILVANPARLYGF